MKYLTALVLVICSVLIGGCAVFSEQPVPLGASEAALIAQLGTPTDRYTLNDGHLLEYRRGPWGQQTYMARIDSSGQLTSYEQVLTTAKFGTIKIGQDNKADVLRTIGAPSETSYLNLVQQEVWSYPYKESGVWDSLMHVYFNHAGIVQRLQNGPDPKFDPDSRGFGFGMLRR